MIRKTGRPPSLRYGSEYCGFANAHCSTAFRN